MIKPIGVPDVPINTVSSANKFGVDLFRMMYGDSPDENLVISPASLWFVLSMAIAGAKGETLEEMRTAMSLEDGFLLSDLGRLQDVERSLGADGTLKIANLIAIQQQYEILPQFLSFCKDSMGAEAWSMDFSDQASVDKINAWVMEVTQGKIENLISQLDPADRIALINAVYLKAKWKSKFDDAKSDWFNSPSGRLACQMMHKKELLRYTKGDNFQSVRIPYVSDRMSMLILLPNPDVKLGNILSVIQVSDIISLLQSSMMIEVDLLLPRFKIERTMSNDLIKSLNRMGLVTMWGGEADFSAITGEDDLYVTQILQKAFIEVDELGTEAAAATSMMLGIKSISSKEDTIQMRVDRPFSYFIIDEQTNLVLFNGVVNKP